ncbi:TPA: hypothetical protein DCX16_06325 [bacterium]|nr:hypothetical protein [bacterium]
MNKKMGITLVELLVALFCMVVMIIVVAQLILITERVHIRTGARVEAEYSIRETLDLMVSELRHAGYRHWDIFNAPSDDSPNFAHHVERIGTESCARTLTFEADFDENGSVTSSERITYAFNQSQRSLLRRCGEEPWEVLIKNVEDVEFGYIGTSGTKIELPLSSKSADDVRMIDMSITFEYPIKGEGKTLTTTLDTKVRLRNTYFKSDVARLGGW